MADALAARTGSAFHTALRLQRERDSAIAGLVAAAAATGCDEPTAVASSRDLSVADDAPVADVASILEADSVAGAASVADIASVADDASVTDVAAVADDASVADAVHDADDVDTVAATDRGACARCATLHPRLEHMARLYIALSQLHAAPHREAVLAAVSEILVNMVGTEDWVVLAADAAGAAVPLASMGDAGDTLTAAQGRAVADVLAGGAGWTGPRTACLPLLRRGRAGGAVVVRSLLRQRGTLDTEQEELLALLRDHALPALLAARPVGAAR